MVCRNHLILMMTLPGALPPPLWHPPVAIVPNCLNAIMEKFPVQAMPRHRKAPHCRRTRRSSPASCLKTLSIPKRGRVGARGANHHLKMDFSRVKKKDPQDPTGSRISMSFPPALLSPASRRLCRGRPWKTHRVSGHRYREWRSLPYLRLRPRTPVPGTSGRPRPSPR